MVSLDPQSTYSLNNPSPPHRAVKQHSKHPETSLRDFIASSTAPWNHSTVQPSCNIKSLDAYSRQEPAAVPKELLQSHSPSQKETDQLAELVCPSRTVPVVLLHMVTRWQLKPLGPFHCASSNAIVLLVLYREQPCCPCKLESFAVREREVLCVDRDRWACARAHRH